MNLEEPQPRCVAKLLWVVGFVLCPICVAVGSSFIHSIVFPQAQYLTAPITSASKLQTNKHHLYLLKDRESNGYT